MLGKRYLAVEKGRTHGGCERNLMVATTAEATMTIAMGMMGNVVANTTIMTVATITIVVVMNVVVASTEYAEDMCAKV